METDFIFLTYLQHLWPDHGRKYSVSISLNHTLADTCTAFLLLCAVLALGVLVYTIAKETAALIVKTVRYGFRLMREMPQAVDKLAALLPVTLHAWYLRHQRTVQFCGRISFHALFTLACFYPPSSPLASFIQNTFMFSLVLVVDRSPLRELLGRTRRALTTRVKTSVAYFVGTLLVFLKMVTVRAAKHVLGVDIDQLLKNLNVLQDGAKLLKAELAAKDETLADSCRTIRERDRALAYKDSTIRVNKKEFVSMDKEMLAMRRRMTQLDESLQKANNQLEQHVKHAAEVNENPSLIPESTIAKHPLFQILSRANHSLVQQAATHKRQREELQATINRRTEEWTRLRSENQDLSSQLTTSKIACVVHESRAAELANRVRGLEKNCEKQVVAYTRLARAGGIQEFLEEHVQLRRTISSSKMELETCRKHERSARKKVEELQAANGQLTATYHMLRDELRALRSSR